MTILEICALSTLVVEVIRLIIDILNYRRNIQIDIEIVDFQLLQKPYMQAFARLQVQFLMSICIKRLTAQVPTLSGRFLTSR